jgi:hypothetical protein
MLKSFGNPIGQKPAASSHPRMRVTLPAKAAAPRPARPEGGHSFTKIFRWRPPDGHAPAPAAVEIVGSFTHWERVPLTRDGAQNVWHVTIHQIPINRTHHYMLLVDGKPVPDKHADGLAVPHGPQEEHYQLPTARGGRVFILYSQTK